MNNYNLYYFKKFMNCQKGKGWKLDFINEIKHKKTNKLPRYIELAPLNSKIRRIISSKKISDVIRHRKAGHAVECANGDKLWYINGEKTAVKYDF